MQEEFDGERIAGIVDRLLKGESLAQASDIPQEDTESVFDQAMELYSQGRYGDAEKLFRLLCLIVHDDSRFWMGLGACLQGLARYADAVDAYPEPICLAREEGDREEAANLTAILPVILEQNDFAKTWSDVWWYKLKSGTGV
ncbi:MAG: tetratricopeptide repeat protein, partial [Mailhella sp.]|nr:tetratricopeptide repeat protein [Mailhella sp.]